MTGQIYRLAVGQLDRYKGENYSHRDVALKLHITDNSCLISNISFLFFSPQPDHGDLLKKFFTPMREIKFFPN